VLAMLGKLIALVKMLLVSTFTSDVLEFALEFIGTNAKLTGVLSS